MWTGDYLPAMNTYVYTAPVIYYLPDKVLLNNYALYGNEENLLLIRNGDTAVMFVLEQGAAVSQ